MLEGWLTCDFKFGDRTLSQHFTQLDAPLIE